MKVPLGLLLGVLASLSTVGAVAGASPCTDCDLVIAEADLPAGYTYDAESPERDPKGTARSIRFDDCVVPERLRREPPGVERQSAVFATEDDPLGGDENVVRFKTVKRARAFTAAFDAYLLEGPQCEVVKARADDGSVFESEQIDRARFVQLVDDAVAAASD